LPTIILNHQNQKASAEFKKKCMPPKQMQDKIPRQTKTGRSVFHYLMLPEFLTHSSGSHDWR